MALEATLASTPPANPALTPTLDATTVPLRGGGLQAPRERLPEIAGDRYTISDEIGRGGIGRVMRARDHILDRTIAIKELHAEDPGTRLRFVREALITARLQHPSIVPVYEAGRTGDAPFYAMKLVAGRTLGEAITAATSLAARLALIPNILAVADAMAYAHGERIVHRDLKPQNVLLGDFGETVVIDWGLAKDLAIDDRDARDAGPFRPGVQPSDQTVAGSVLGTPAYMAPEQAEGKDVDERADVYALGAMLYHLVAGKIPHEGASLDVMLERILSGEVIAIAKREPNTPPDLAAIIGKAMARDPAGRYATARELAEDLRRFQTGQLVGAHRYTLGERVRRWVRRRRAVVAIAALATVILLSFGVWSIRRIMMEQGRANREAEQVHEARRIAAENTNRGILARAATALEHDPAEVLALLSAFDPEGPGWDKARAMATGALSRPRPDRILPGLSRDAAMLVGDHDMVLQATPRAVWVANLATSEVWNFAIVSTGMPQLCDDGKRIAGYGSLAGAPASHFTITLATGEITLAAMTPADSQRRLASCTARARFIRDGNQVVLSDDPAQPPRALGSAMFSWMEVTADHEHALTLAMDRTMTRWNRSGAAESLKMRVTTHDKFASSADGRITVFGGSQIDAWDITTGKHYEISKEPAHTIAIAADGTWLVAANHDRVGIIGLDGKVRRMFRHSGTDWVTISPDGRWVLAVGDQLVLWEVDAPEPTVLEGDRRVVAATFSGNAIVTMDAEGRVRRWPLEAARPMVPMEAGGGMMVDAAARSPDGGVVVTTTESRVIRTRGAAVESVELPAGLAPVHLAVNAGGDALIARPNGVWLWRTGGRLEALGAHDNVVRWPDGLHVAWARDLPISWDGLSLVIWEPAGPRVLAAPPTEGLPEMIESALAVSPDGRWVSASQALPPEGKWQHPRRILLFDLERHTTTELPDARGEHAAFSPDGKTLATGDVGGELVLWSMPGLERKTVGRGDVRSAVTAFSPDGAHVALVGTGEIVIADLAHGTSGLLTSPNEVSFHNALWSPNGDILVLAADDHIRIHEVASQVSWAMFLRPIALETAGKSIVVTTRYRRVTLADALPREPMAFVAWLKRLPFRLDARNRPYTEPR